MNSARTRALSFALAFVALASLALVGVGQSQAVIPIAGSRIWPPLPTNIVNLSNENLPGGQPVIVPGQSTLVVYSVPADSWLVVTAVLFGNSTFEVYEELGGAMTFKGRGLGGGNPFLRPQEMAGPMGWAFAPGSSVVFRNPDPSAASLTFSLAGYRAR